MVIKSLFQPLGALDLSPTHQWVNTSSENLEPGSLRTQDTDLPTSGQASALVSPGPQSHQPAGRHQIQNHHSPTVSHVRNQPKHQQDFTSLGTTWALTLVHQQDNTMSETPWAPQPSTL